MTIGAALCAITMHSGWAQGLTTDASMQGSDPPRWYQEDLSPRGRFLTRKKDAGAALQEARLACKKAERAARAACAQQALSQFEQDMAAARQQTGVQGR